MAQAGMAQAWAHVAHLGWADADRSFEEYVVAAWRIRLQRRKGNTAESSRATFEKPLGRSAASPATGKKSARRVELTSGCSAGGV
eukprot:scaffold102061_cov57-Phaeocystis_antarctica.AAC.2